jgi:hypothetical protein
MADQDYEYLKARHDILLAAVKHYADIHRWESSGHDSAWTPKNLYKSDKKKSGYDAAHTVLSTLDKMEQKRKDAKTFAAEQKRLYTSRTKHLYPKTNLPD